MTNLRKMSNEELVKEYYETAYSIGETNQIDDDLMVSEFRYSAELLRRLSEREELIEALKDITVRANVVIACNPYHASFGLQKNKLLQSSRAARAILSKIKEQQ